MLGQTVNPTGSSARGNETRPYRGFPTTAVLELRTMGGEEEGERGGGEEEGRRRGRGEEGDDV